MVAANDEIDVTCGQGGKKASIFTAQDNHHVIFVYQENTLSFSHDTAISH